MKTELIDEITTDFVIHLKRNDLNRTNGNETERGVGKTIDSEHTAKKAVELLRLVVTRQRYANGDTCFFFA